MFKTHLLVAIEYRSNVIGKLVLQLVGLASVGILFVSIFANQKEIAGLSLNDTFYYYLLVPIIGMITGIGMAEPIGDEIREGVLSNHLLKPQHIWLQYITRWLAAKMSTLLILFPFYLIIGIAVHLFIPSIDFLPLILIGIPLAFVAYLLSLLIDLAFAWLAFWVDTLWWVQHLKNFLFGIFAGASIPLDFFPENLRKIANFLPFRFLYYVPIQYSLQRSSLSNLPQDLLVMFSWFIVIYIVALILWKRGIKKYDAFGN